MTSPGSRPAVSRLDFLPWEYAAGASPAERERQAERRHELTGETELAADAFVAETAAVFCNVLRMGERSYIGAHAYVTGEVSVGVDSTINPFTVVRGKVTLGDGVRIGAHASLLAFNHGTAPDQPIFRQAHTARGITVGDDVWIGSNALILDGVTIGPHSIVGAGAVVTKNVAPWSVVAGNPAKNSETAARPPRHLLLYLQWICLGWRGRLLGGRGSRRMRWWGGVGTGSGLWISQEVSLRSARGAMRSNCPTCW